jgi:integrase
MRDIRKKDSEGQCPLRWCVTYKRNRRYYSTGISLNLKDWELFEVSENSDFNFKTKARHLKENKNDLEVYFENKLKPIVKELADNFTFEGLGNKLGKSDISNLNEAFQAKIDDLYENDRVNYAESFKSTLKSIEDFSGKDINFNSITPDFLRKYEKHLLNSGKTVTTVGFYMRNLRVIINGDGEPYLKGGKYPFGVGGYKYTIPKGERREMALELGQIHMIQVHRCEPSSEIYRNMWVFSFYGNGINMTDICRLKYSEIQNGEITFVRKKTKNKRRTVVRIYIPITRPIQDIINKHGNKNKDGYIFPFLNGIETEKQIVRKIADVTKNVNETIRHITKELNLPEGITAYSTRHSYVTILERLNVPRIFIQNSLGHTTESVTDNYSKMAERELRFKYNSFLLPKSNEEVLKSLVETARMELIFN